MDLPAYARAIVGALFSLVLLWYGFEHWMKRAWGMLITHIAGAAVVAYILYKPEAAMSLLQSLGDMIAAFFRR
ncbi:TcpD family membrane protein [Streptomyces erythrochromogenes]|uniref:TcpD family membrane protein n=1 Tax=Streptomyces erythrochromogenes TaxID=285574 RepID=UPI00342689A4